MKNGINSKEVLRKIEDDERKSKRDSYDETTSALNSQVFRISHGNAGMLPSVYVCYLLVLLVCV